MSDDNAYKIGERVQWRSDWNKPKVDPDAATITGVIVGESQKSFSVRIDSPANLRGQVVSMNAWCFFAPERPAPEVKRLKLGRPQ